MEDINFNYLKDEIPQFLIEECNRISEETGDTYFIFDNSITNIIRSMNIWSEDDRRDLVIDNLLEEDIYHIGDINYFIGMPTRWSYYDTETKLIDRYGRYNFILDFIKEIGFEPVLSNLGPEYEQSFIIEKDKYKWILRIKSNLFIRISYQNSEMGYLTTIFDSFFNKSLILDSIKKSNPKIFDMIVRDIKLKELLQ